VVSLAPAATEFVVALDATDRLVGVDAVSQRNPALGALPVVADLADAAGLAPDVVLVSQLPGASATAAQELRRAGIEVIEFAPHDLADAFELCRGFGARLVGTATASLFERDISRALAEIGGSSFGQPRPRVLALVGPAPFQIAGGHSFATDLIEIAGGQSVTHQSEEWRIASADAELWPAPDLVLFIGTAPPTEDERWDALVDLPPAPRVEFLAFDAQLRWALDSVEAARRLRTVIEPLSRRLATGGTAGPDTSATDQEAGRSR
jgi:ABC-type hemin transport system substrate-binding protein